MNENAAANRVRTLKENRVQYLYTWLWGERGVLFQKNIWSFLFGHIKNITKPPPKQTELKFNTMACVFQPVINIKK